MEFHSRKHFYGVSVRTKLKFYGLLEPVALPKKLSLSEWGDKDYKSNSERDNSGAYMFLIVLSCKMEMIVWLEMRFIKKI